MLSFLFCLLSHGPVKKQKFCTAGICLYLILSTIPFYQPFSGPFFYLLLYFSSFMQQAHSKDLALGPCSHLGELSHGFYLNLAFRNMWKSLSMFRVGIRKEIILGFPWLSLLTKDPESWGSCGHGYLWKIFVYKLAMFSIVKRSQ